MNMLLKHKYIYAYLAIMALIAMPSCDDKDTYDVMGDKGNTVFINTQDRNALNTPVNSYSYAVVHTLEGSTSSKPIVAKFPIRTTKPVGNNITIKAEVDNSLIAAFNDANGTAFKPVPDGMIKLNNMATTIVANASMSTDSIWVSVDESKLASLTEKSYLVPIKIASVSDGSLPISASYKTAYIVISTKIVVVKPNVPSTAMLGTLVTDYSAWTVMSDLESNTGTYASMFDNSTTSRWGFAAMPLTIIVDMKAVKNVGGLRLFAYRAASNYTFSNVIVSVSTDAIEYKELGVSTTESMSNESGYQYIGFYETVQARFVKLTLTWRSTSQRGISELGVYTQ